MTQDNMKHKETRIAHLARGHKMPDLGIRTVNPPVYRGSSLLCRSVAEYNHLASPSQIRQRHHNGYGTGGTDTHKALESLMADLEDAEESVLFPSGLSAITSTLLAFCQHGDHVLITDNCYGPSKRFVDRVLVPMGVEVSVFDPLDSLEDIKALIRPNTSCLLAESPGSQTFEMTDLQGLARLAKAHNIITIMDNTWASPLYCQPLRLGVDLSLHAVTKYIGGHSDLLMGAVSGNGETIWKVRNMHFLLGHNTSPDDVSLALRGARSLSARMAQHQQSAFVMAKWLQQRQDVADVLYPALPSHPGYKLWQRDFSGAGSLFSFVLAPDVTIAQAERFCNSLTLFGLADSWGSYESLIKMCGDIRRSSPRWQAYQDKSGPVVRMFVGLENVDDLREDIEHGFQAMYADGE